MIQYPNTCKTTVMIGLTMESYPDSQHAGAGNRLIDRYIGYGYVHTLL
jgi:hypothetical protein